LYYNRDQTLLMIPQPIDFNAVGVIIATHDGPQMPLVPPRIGTFICGLAMIPIILLSIQLSQNVVNAVFPCQKLKACSYYHAARFTCESPGVLFV
jgi:hypothetical protein